MYRRYRSAHTGVWHLVDPAVGADGEFNFKELEEFCAGKGIEHEVIAPYTSQHNGEKK